MTPCARNASRHAEARAPACGAQGPHRGSVPGAPRLSARARVHTHTHTHTHTAVARQYTHRSGASARVSTAQRSNKAWAPDSACQLCNACSTQGVR